MLEVFTYCVISSFMIEFISMTNYYFLSKVYDAGGKVFHVYL